jgi:hypothetical protein
MIKNNSLIKELKMIRTIYKSITYDDGTNTVKGTITDYKELNKMFPGTTEYINGSCEAVKQYLSGTTNPKYLRWGESRLNHLFKAEYKIIKPKYEVVSTSPVFKPAPLKPL